MHEETGGVIAFFLIAVAVPIGYAVVNGGIRYLLTSENKAENRYLGVDLTLAALVSVGLYTLEPQSRLLPPLKWVTPEMAAFKNNYGPGVALGLDVFLLIVAMCIHKDYLDNHCKIANPSRKQKAVAGLKNGLGNNLLGFLAFLISAFLMRG